MHFPNIHVFGWPRTVFIVNDWRSRAVVKSFFSPSTVFVNFSMFLIIFLSSRPASSKIHSCHHRSANICWLQQAIKMNKIQEKLYLRTLCISTAPPVNGLSPINAHSVRLNGGCLAWKCRAAVIGTINGAFEPRMHSLCCSWCIGVHCRALPGLRRPLDAGAEEPLRTMHLSRPLTALTRYPPPPPPTTMLPLVGFPKAWPPTLAAWRN